MKLDPCPMAKFTQERIKCKALKDQISELCIHQYYKQCKGRYELTPGAQECPLSKKEND